MAALANFALVSSSVAHGPVKFDVVTFTGATYANTGAPATSGNTGFKAGLGDLKGANPTPQVLLQEGPTQYALQYDSVNDLLRVFTASSGVEIANAVDLSGVTFRVLVISY